MLRLILRWLINAVALIAAARFISGFHIETFYAAVIAALVLGLLNAVVRPVLVLLTLPINIVTLGLFTFFINGLLVWFMSSFVKGVSIDGFLPALMVAIFLWAVSTITSWFLKTE